MKKLLYTLSLALLGTLAHAQVKIGSNPGTIGSSSNLEIEASNGNKTSVNKSTGQVTITDGTQAAGKVLTSDANGGTSWQSPYIQTSNVITGTYDATKTSIPITYPVTGDQIIPDCPITLNKGTYMLLYYGQFDSAVVFDVNDITTHPSYVYLDFVVSSGVATFPSYWWVVTGQTNGPFVLPVINFGQVAGSVSQLVVVTQDNTVIRPRFKRFTKNGSLSNVGPITAVQL